MLVYFDKANLVSFLYANKDNRFRYCEETLLQHCHVCMNFQKDELLEDTDENSMIKEWMKRCSDGFDTISWSWGTNFPERQIKSNTPLSFSKSQHSAVYLITDENLELLKNKNQYLVSSWGEEIDSLANLWFDDRQYIKNIFDDLINWKVLSNYQSPCSDIVICDQFFLLDETLLDSNLYVLLSQLCYESKKSKMNIVIFTLKEHYGKQCADCDKVRTKIQRLIAEKTGQKPNVAIVTGSSQKLGEHDRTIFTNYKLYTSGDSFNYFNSSGKKITRGRFFHVYSLASKDNRLTACGFLNDMQSLYDSIKQSAPENIHKESSCRSNYLQL